MHQILQEHKTQAHIDTAGFCFATHFVQVTVWVQLMSLCNVQVNYNFMRNNYDCDISSCKQLTVADLTCVFLQTDI